MRTQETVNDTIEPNVKPIAKFTITKSTIEQIDALLASFGPFGVELGLERILRVLEDLGQPQQRVPFIHVAGTNGKGSVCAYLSSILSAAGYRVGRYTSPHLVSWCERICIDDEPIAPDVLHALLLQVQQAIRPDRPSPTQFEVITAAAWLYFEQQQVDLAVMEVGLGGRLDATNVSDRPLVSVITSISREHWQRLGPTVADIAGEKAGILKPGCPAVIGVLPPDAEAVVKKRVAEVDCDATWVNPAEDAGQGQARYPVTDSVGNSITYPLTLPGAHQRMNSALAIAAIHQLRLQGWTVSDTAIVEGIRQVRWPGRIQWLTWRGHELLIDGAHNPAAAAVLRQYVDESDRVTRPVTWVMGMLSTKDHADIFSELLREGDRLLLVPVPDHSTADPAALATLAHTICPGLTHCHSCTDVFTALDQATSGLPASSEERPSGTVILCGSLYLIGHFMGASLEAGEGSL